MSDMKTPLHVLHEKRDAKIVPFAGYAMPLQYEGIMAEHLHTRTKASLFDVSHMGQVRLYGTYADQLAFLEKVTPAAVADMAPHQMRYSVLLNDQGGIVDDLMIIRHTDGFDMVVNAGRRAVDMAHFKAFSKNVGVVMMDDMVLLAVQGPLAIASLAPHCADPIITMPFMTGSHTSLFDIPVFMTRSGYTGEDGVEISVKEDMAVSLAEKILDLPHLKLAGLGARDTLRLEAGLPLYGQDLNDTITPVMAGLSWVIAKSRREAPSFLGATRIMQDLNQKPMRCRVAFKADTKQPIRPHTPIYHQDIQIGEVTSGTTSPTLGYAVMLGMVNTGYKDGLTARVRGHDIFLEPVKLPFVPHNYYKGA
jgi:aminomethyltransferase